VTENYLLPTFGKLSLGDLQVSTVQVSLQGLDNQISPLNP
jgi:hypothetical protein